MLNFVEGKWQTVINFTLLCPPSLIIVCESFLNTSHSFECSSFISHHQCSLSGKHSFVPNGCGWVLNQWHVSAGHVTCGETYPALHFLSKIFLSSHTFTSSLSSQTPHFERENYLPLFSMIRPLVESLLISTHCDCHCVKFFAHSAKNESSLKYLE